MAVACALLVYGTEVLVIGLMVDVVPDSVVLVALEVVAVVVADEMLALLDEEIARLLDEEAAPLLDDAAAPKLAKNATMIKWICMFGSSLLLCRLNRQSARPKYIYNLAWNKRLGRFYAKSGLINVIQCP